MKIRADVVHATGRTKHMIGKVKAGRIVGSDLLPAPAWVEISEESGMFYLLRCNADGQSFADTCHITLNEAKAQAELEYSIPVTAWRPVD